MKAHTLLRWMLRVRNTTSSDQWILPLRVWDRNHNSSNGSCLASLAASQPTSSLSEAPSASSWESPGPTESKSSTTSTPTSYISFGGSALLLML